MLRLKMSRPQLTCPEADAEEAAAGGEAGTDEERQPLGAVGRRRCAGDRLLRLGFGAALRLGARGAMAAARSPSRNPTGTRGLVLDPAAAEAPCPALSIWGWAQRKGGEGATPWCSSLLPL